jgi:hypothetical protein
MATCERLDLGEQCRCVGLGGDEAITAELELAVGRGRHLLRSRASSSFPP